MRNTIRTAIVAALWAAALGVSATSLAGGADDSLRVKKARFGSLRRENMVVVDVTGVPDGSGGVDTNAVRDIVEEYDRSIIEPREAARGGVDTNAVEDIARRIAGALTPGDIGALPDTYTPPVASVNGKTGEVYLAAADIPGAATTGDVEYVVGEYDRTNLATRISAVSNKVSDAEGRVSAVEGRLVEFSDWRRTNALTRVAAESGFTDWVVLSTRAPGSEQPALPDDVVVGRVVVPGGYMDFWSLFHAGVPHFATNAIVGLAPGGSGVTRLEWLGTEWGDIAATRVRVPTAEELDAKIGTNELQAVATGLQGRIDTLDAGLSSTSNTVAGLASGKADKTITVRRLSLPRMDRDDVWVVDMDGTVFRFAGEESGFRTWIGTNWNNTVWRYTDTDDSTEVIPKAVEYKMVEATPNNLVSEFAVRAVDSYHICGFPTVQSGIQVIVYPPADPDWDATEQFPLDTLRFSYVAGAVPAQSDVALSYMPQGDGGSWSNIVRVSRGRLHSVESQVVYGMELDSAVARLRSDLVSRADVAAGFTEWVVVPERDLGVEVVVRPFPRRDEGPVASSQWSLVYATNTTIQVAPPKGGASATNLVWEASETIFDVAVAASRARVPSMADIDSVRQTAAARWAVAMSNDTWLVGYATNTYTAAERVGRRVKDLEAWQYTNSVSRSDIERGVTDWAVTPMWPLGRVEVRQIVDGADAGKWTLFRPGESESMTNIVPQASADNPVTNLVWDDVLMAVDVRWTNGLAKAGIPWDGLAVDTASGKTNVTARFNVVARRTVIRGGVPGDYAAVSNAAMNAMRRDGDTTGGAIKFCYDKDDPEWETFTLGNIGDSLGIVLNCAWFGFSRGNELLTPNVAFYPDVITRFYDSRDMLIHHNAQRPWDDLDGKWLSMFNVIETAMGAARVATNLVAVTATNAARIAAVEALRQKKQDRLPYPTNAIPYSAIATPINRHALFVIDLNPGETRVWSGIELKATTNNFAVTESGEGMLFYCPTVINGEKGEDELYNVSTNDWCRLFILSKRADSDIRRWTAISNTHDLSGYAPLSLAVLVSQDKLRRVADTSWLYEGNKELIWSFVRIAAGGGPETDQDGRQCWRPIMPVKWYDELPDWASQSPVVFDSDGIKTYVAPWLETIEDVDASYQRFGTAASVSQSVQYVTNAPGGVLNVEIPVGVGTKDWVMYCNVQSNTAIRLPPATWWMADAAYTNAISANQPTALRFTRVTDGVYMLSRQELTSVRVE